jgi:hypothetical protein
MKEETMPKRRVLHNDASQKALPPGLPEQASRAEKAPVPRQPINIDDLCVSPWVGLHYRHEFLLHHRHELLVQHKD